MMNIRQRSVNVSRVELLAKLKENLATHRKEYQEALVEYGWEFQNRQRQERKAFQHLGVSLEISARRLSNTNRNNP